MNFKGVVTAYSDSALTLARDYLPTAILLDIDLTDVDGFAERDRLKRDPGTRHIPVHVLSSQQEREQSLRQGAISFLAKPVPPERLQEEFTRIQEFLTNGKRMLLGGEDDPVQRETIIDLIGNADIDIVSGDTGEKALDAVHASHFDCMVLDLTLPEIKGIVLLVV